MTAGVVADDVTSAAAIVTVEAVFAAKTFVKDKAAAVDADGNNTSTTIEGVIKLNAAVAEALLVLVPPISTLLKVSSIHVNKFTLDNLY